MICSLYVLFLLIAFVTLWGTVFPIFSETFDETTMTIGQPFFNKVNGPLMLLLIFLMGIGPLLPWRKASLNSLFKMLTFPLILSILIVSVCLLLGLTKIWAIFGFATCAIALGGIIQEWFRGTKSRVKKTRKSRFFIRRVPRGGGPEGGPFDVLDKANVFLHRQRGAPTTAYPPDASCR